ncbi:MAG: COP23 domain-containing protein [Leptolyngbyaceae cyanobacterium MO_188.B28]|nr:COP23 domain-containing protein [Leptolyngbyaceae cyanobacterium MO_188.B28]
MMSKSRGSYYASILAFATLLLASCTKSPKSPPKMVDSSKLQPVDSSKEILYQGEAYFCNEEIENPTVVARSDLGNVSIIKFMEDLYGVSPLERCQQVAERLIKFHTERNIGYLSWARSLNGRRVINISKHEGNIHSESEEYVDLLLTLHPDDQVHEILEELHGILSSYGDKPIWN